VLYHNPQVGWMTAVQWSPDGRQILVVLHREKAASQLALISVADGSARVLKTFERELPRKMSISLDGRTIAYDLIAQANAPERDIFLLATDGSGETPLVQHPSDDTVIGWAPDGKSLLFATDRTGTPSAWLVRVSDGKAQGAPELVKQGLGAILPLGFTRSGALFYVLQVGIRDVFTATLDPATGQVQTPPQPVDPRLVGSKSDPAWSPDGRYLAYLSRGGSTPPSGTCIVSIRAVASGEARELSLWLDSMTEIGWSADGRSLLAVGQDKQGRLGAFRIDAQTGAITFFPDPGGFGRGVAWGLD
jgi:Tol biopolymer transport system component